MYIKSGFDNTSTSFAYYDGNTIQDQQTTCMHQLKLLKENAKGDSEHPHNISIIQTFRMNFLWCGKQEECETGKVESLDTLPKPPPSQMIKNSPPLVLASVKAQSLAE